MLDDRYLPIAPELLPSARLHFSPPDYFSSTRCPCLFFDPCDPTPITLLSSTRENEAPLQQLVAQQDLAATFAESARRGAVGKCEIRAFRWILAGQCGGQVSSRLRLQ